MVRVNGRRSGGRMLRESMEVVMVVDGSCLFLFWWVWEWMRVWKVEKSGMFCCFFRVDR